MKENTLKYIDGKKIRMQLFSIPIIMHFAMMFILPFIFLIVSLNENTFELSKWLNELLTSIWVTLFLSLPWIILSILNRRIFGKIICVLTEKGVHLNGRFIEWRDIIRAEYTIANQRRYKYDANKSCRVTIYTENDSVTVLHAPIYILSAMKKYRKDIQVSLSSSSKWQIAIYFLLSVLLLFFTIFFPNK